MNDTTTALPAEAGGYEIARFSALRHGVAFWAKGAETRASTSHEDPDGEGREVQVWLPDRLGAAEPVVIAKHGGRWLSSWQRPQEW